MIHVLHAALEYGNPGQHGEISVGGIGSVLKSLCLAQKKNKNLDSRVIMPYYATLHGSLDSFEFVTKVTHCFDGGPVESKIYKQATPDNNIIKYVVKPEEQEHHQMFTDIFFTGIIYSDFGNSLFIRRACYFASAVAAFAVTNDDSEDSVFCPDILQGHGLALAFLGKLIQKYQRLDPKHKTPKTVYVFHSGHQDDAVYDYEEMPDIGIAHNNSISLTINIIQNGYDHMVYVSEQLLKESIESQETIFSDVIKYNYNIGRASAILNNICADEFDPSIHFPHKFNLQNIVGSKIQCKANLNNLLREDLIYSNKTIKLENPLTLYIGRYSEEKGIDRLETAIDIVLQNHGTFIAMGKGVPLIIRKLINSYQNNPSVIIFTNGEHQEKYGRLIRAAADIYFVPSRSEACGLVPMEANITGALVVAAKIGGLSNVVIPDANGVLFEDEQSLPTRLQMIHSIWHDMKEHKNLNTVLQLVQESATKSFDWNSETTGSETKYFKLYTELSRNVVSEPNKIKNNYIGSII